MVSVSTEAMGSMMAQNRSTGVYVMSYASAVALANCAITTRCRGCDRIHYIGFAGNDNGVADVIEYII